MQEILEIIVIFNGIEIIRQFFPRTQQKSNESTDCNHQIESNKSDSILVFSDFCQTIRFLKELDLCLNYRLKVFDGLKVFKKTRFSSCGQTVIFGQNHCVNSIHTEDQDTDIRVLVKLKSIDHYLAIDKNWNKRILNLVVVRFRIEDSLSWLSTLGGAYSSLGEYNINCVSNPLMKAVKAGQISISQLGLAAITGDPNIIARCGIYMAYSLCQQNRRGEAIKMIRRTLYPFIAGIKKCDKMVISMYSALCYRIQNFDNNLNKKI